MLYIVFNDFTAHCYSLFYIIMCMLPAEYIAKRLVQQALFICLITI